MLSCLDEGVGNVTRALTSKGMAEDLVLFVTADNGSPTPSCGGYQGGQNYPLRGGKCSCWEGGLRATAFVHSALLPAAARGTRFEALMHAVDVLPTLLGAAEGGLGLSLFSAKQSAQGRPLDGMNMVRQT